MIEELGSVYVFLSILALIVIEISSVLRKIDLENEIGVPGLLSPFFPNIKIVGQCSLLGRFGFLHGVNHLLLALGCFISIGIGTIFKLHFTAFFSTVLLGVVWIIYPFLETVDIYGKMLRKKMIINSWLTHVGVVMISMILIVFFLILLMKPDGWWIEPSMVIILIVVCASPALYLKVLYKEVIKLKESRWLVEN
ncbi:MAG: hypothetical protein KJ886_00125 [Candidatus Thermoplasmatota archaeon]|nr:hypothetical protein [Candidatus Thermoplasmatota archaeon]MBU4255904.1 hypothetical protein [Candidatus Thermoplasmatota archaeon]MCG2825031.1 hypothetical protein [Thermoplasmatales archaeon]